MSKLRNQLKRDMMSADMLPVNEKIRRKPKMDKKGAQVNNGKYARRESNKW